MKKWIKVIGMAALSGAAIAVGEALADALAHAGDVGATIGGILTTILALYMKRPAKDDTPEAPARLHLVLVPLLLLAAAPAGAQGPSQWGFNTFTTAVTVVGTTETTIVASPVVTCPRGECDVVVLCYAELTTGADTTDVIISLRRTAVVGGTLVNEQNSQDVKAAAGSIEPFISFFSEQVTRTNVQYNCTLDQVGASADGSAIYGGILVLVR